MKIAISIILSFILGLASMYAILGKSFSVVNQMGQENYIDTNIRYFELLEQNKVEALKGILKISIDCESSVYEQNLDSLFWEKTDRSASILDKSKPYKDLDGDCNKRRITDV